MEKFKKNKCAKKCPKTEKQKLTDDEDMAVIFFVQLIHYVVNYCVQVCKKKKKETPTEGSVQYTNCSVGSEEKILKMILMFRLCCSV